MAENSPAEQRGLVRGRPFKKGESGNRAGKPKGARHKTTLLAEKLMQDDAKAIVAAVLTAARDGDMTAARIVLDRIAPARRDNPVQFDLPKIESAADAAKAMGAILGAVAKGELTPTEADGVTRIVEGFVKALEASEFEMRLRALEEREGSK